MQMAQQLVVSSRSTPTTSDKQAFADVFALNDGGFMVSWSSMDQDSAGTYGVYAQRYNSDGTTNGSEFLVNTTTANAQRDPEGLQLSNDEIVFVWGSTGQDGDASGIYLKHYDDNGTAQTGEILANTTTTGSQYAPGITALNDGGYLVAWVDYEADAGKGDIYAQRFNATGSKLGSEFLVNTHTNGNQTINDSSLITLSNGNVVVTWRDSDAQDGDGNGVFAQIIEADGTKVGSEFQVNTHTESSQYDPAITALDDGGFLVTWSSLPGTGNPYNSDSDYAVMAQRFDADGTKIGDEFQINSTTSGWQFQPAVTTLTDGSMVFSWDSNGQDGSSYGVYTKKFTYHPDDDIIRGEDGNDTIYGDAGDDVIYGGDEPLFYELVAGSETAVNTYTTNNQRYSSVTALDGGGYVIVWESDGQDTDDYGIYGQRYNADGSTAGSEFAVNTTTADKQVNASVFALSDGGFMVSWSSYDQDNSGDYGVYAQRYNGDGTTNGSEFLVNTTTSDNQRDPTGLQLSNDEIVFVWRSNGQDGDGDGIYLKHYNNSGTDLTGEILVNTKTAGEQYAPAITALDDGGYLVTWTDYDADSDGAEVFAQRFDEDGVKVGSEFQINTYLDKNQGSNNDGIATLSNGNVIVVWTSSGTGEDTQDGSDEGVFAQIIQPDGTKVDAEFQVNTIQPPLSTMLPLQH